MKAALRTAFLLVVLILPSSLFGETAHPLFRPLADEPGKASPLPSLRPGVLRQARIVVDLESLQGSDGTELKASPISPASPMLARLDLFGDATYTARLEPRASETLPYVVWRGPIDGIEGSQVILVAGGGQIAASINTMGRFFRIGPDQHSARRSEVEPKVHLLEELQLHPQPVDLDPLEVDDESEEPEEAPFSAPSADEGRRDDGSVIDFLVVYTPEAQHEMGDDPVAIRNLITLGIEALDTTFRRSGIPARARLMQVAEVPYEEDPDVGIDLARLRLPKDGYIDEVHALRDTFHADFVAMVRGTRNCSTPDQCGRSIIMRGSNNTAFASSAFSVIAVDRVNDATYSLAHEIGHNLGCNHAPDDPTGSGAFDYSYGYKDPHAIFSTLMAYWCGPIYCPKILNFSSAEVTLGGAATGGEGQNNALSINNIRVLASNFRVSAPAPPTGGGGRCNAKRGPFAACQGGGCSVCALKIADYPRYLVNHPGCGLNTACSGRRFQSCSRSCPAPSSADR